MDFQMSSQAHAIQAVDLLLAAGHERAHHIGRFDEERRHFINVPADSRGVDFEVWRLVRAVDPDAQPSAEPTQRYSGRDPLDLDASARPRRARPLSQ